MSTVTVRLEVVDTAAADALMRFIDSSGDLLLHEQGAAGIADVIVMELQPETAEVTFGRVETLAKTAPQTEVILLAPAADQELLLRSIRSGVKEFLILPLTESEVERALNRMTESFKAGRAEGTRRAGKVVAVLGGKAGVGTSTTAVNLGLALQATSPTGKVAVVDVNLRGGDIPAMLDINPMRSLQDIDSDLSRLDDTFLMGIVSHHSSGLCVLPLGEVDLAGGYVTSECVDETIRLMRTMFDYVVLDCGHVADVAIQNALLSVECLCLVTTLSVPAVRRSKRLLAQFEKMDDGNGLDSIAIVLNKCTDEDAPILDDLEEMLGKKPIAVLPADAPAAGRSINEGVPLLIHAPKCALAKEIRKLGATIAGGGVQATEGNRSSLFGGIVRSVSGRFSRGTPSPSMAS